jgi:amino acid transporter
MFNPKKRIKLENKHMATFFFMWFLILFGMAIYQATQKHYVNVILAIVMFFCLILSMSFKTWALIREMDNKLDILIEKRVL